MSYKRSRATFESDPSAPPHHAPYALFGTPLPAYDSDARDDGSYVPIWKQEVTDERGRKRLHGAFTGGFSAGYFNTVGSKEGWTPSAFVSSRSKRAKDQQDGKAAKHSQRPEDFMDDEDLAEQAESQRLETQHTFAGLGNSESSGGSRAVFSDLFKTTGETKGIKLLQSMGWRQGQGIGPKVKRHAYGDKTGEMHMFAPENSRMIAFARKTDRKGLGYAEEGRPSSGCNDLATQHDEESGDDARRFNIHRSKTATAPKPRKKTGFGVGVLNDDGSDDDDPYAMGPKISYNRIIGANKNKKKGIVVSNSNSTSVTKPTFAPNKLSQAKTITTQSHRCHDGRLPLHGFILATAALAISDDNKYAAPDVPAGWKPSQLTSATAGEPAKYQSTADAAKASSLDVRSRADLLGEQPLPGKSVFDFLKPEARERLAAASGKTILPPALGEGAPAGFQSNEADKRRTLWDLVPNLPKQTAAAALQRGISGWMPYAEDEDKRARYKYFLELSDGLQSNLPERPKAMSVDEWSKEMREFADAAEIFKPVSGLMASRFTTSMDEGPKLASDATDTKESVEDPAEKAARMGMYGPMTRSKQPFYPTRLLCKRFNVRPPANVAPGDTEAGVEETASESNRRLEVVSQASLDRMMAEANLQMPSFVAGPARSGSDKDSSTNSSRMQPVRIDVETNDALEGKRAGEDLFKAVFGSDSEDD